MSGKRIVSSWTDEPGVGIVGEGFISNDDLLSPEELSRRSLVKLFEEIKDLRMEEVLEMAPSGFVECFV